MDANNSFQDLKHFCEDKPSIKKKLGLMTHHHSEKTPDWIDRLIMAIEYLQLLSQAFLCFPETILSFQNSEDTHHFFKFVLSFLKIFNPSCILTYSNSDHLGFNILILILVITVIKYVFIGEIIWQAFLKKADPPHFLLKTFWRWIYKLQTRLIYFLITSFWIEAIVAISKEEFTFLGSNKPWNIAFLSTLIAIEYFFSIILETQFCYLLPTRDYLSHKSFDLQIITLTQKLALQIVYAAFRENSQAFIWVFSSLSVSFCCLRSLVYYKTLPLYHQEALTTQSDLLSLTNIASIVCFFQAILWTSDYIQFNDNFYILTWIVLSILLIKMSRGYLQNLILDLLVKNSTKLSPELQVHKIHLTKQYQREFTTPKMTTSNYDFKYLVLNTEKIQTQSDPLHDDIHKVFLQSLEKLPHSSFIKLHIAYLCSKNNDLYAKAIKVLASIKQNAWSKLYLTVSFLYLRIEKSIMLNSKNTFESEEQLDLLTYIKSLVLVQELKKEMLQQTQLTVGICKEILNEISDVGKIFDHAQKIHKYRTKISKKFINLSTNIPDYFLEPLRLCAEYQLALNFSASDYGKYMEIHTIKYSKHEKHFKNPALIQENLYQNTNVFLLVSSGQKFDHGQIVFSSKSTEELCGISYKSHISSLFPLHLQAFFTEFFKQISESGGSHQNSLLNKVFTTFVYNKNGYMTEADIFVRFHPYITEDLYLNVVIRPILNAEECLLIQENGDIVGVTKLLAKKLQLTQKKNKLNAMNIKTISEELYEANEALNLLKSIGGVNIDERIGENIEIHTREDASNIEAKLSSPARKRNQHHQGLSYEKAIEVYHTFYKEGQEVSISPPQMQNHSSPLYFHCTISFIQFGSVILKRLHLNPSSREISKSEKDSLNNPDLEEFNHNKETNSLFGSENIDDCHEIKKGEELFTEWKADAPLNTYHNLLTPKSQGDLPLLLLNPQKIMMTTNNDPEDPAVISEFVLSEQFDEPVKNLQRKQTMKQELIDSDPYQERVEQNTFTTFNRALSTKSYPKAFNLLSAIYYFLVILILCSQVILKVISDNTTENLRIKKDMLNSAQIRTFSVVKVQADSRGITTLISGIVLPDQIGNTGQNTSQLLDLTKSYLDNIVTADNNIRKNINYLDHEIKDLLFLQDVGIVGSYNDLLNQDSQNVTTFQAIDIVQTALRKAYNLPTIRSPQGYQIFHFIVQNTINDIVYKNNLMNEKFIESVNEEKNHLQAIIMLCLIIVPIILFFIYLALLYIIWTQYSIKKTNMLAFVKLHPNRVKSLMQSLNKFADLLTDKELLPEKSKLSALNPHKNRHKTAAYHKNHIIKSVNYSQMIKRYYKYTFLITLYVLILFSIIFANFISASHSTKIIYKKQQQLQFANQLSVGCIVGYISVVELFVSNDTNLIQHLSPQNSLISALHQIDDYQKEANTIFMNSNDGDYDPEVYSLLFDSNECSELTGIFQLYCQGLVDSGQSGSIVQSLSLLRSSLDAGLSSFQAANKSSLLYLISVGLRNYEKIVISANVIAAKSQLISQIIDAQLNKSITDTNTQRSILLAVFIVGLIIAIILIWYQALVKVREVNNDFKKVLKTFPPNFILSSFLLKTFLRDNSQGVFDL